MTLQEETYQQTGTYCGFLFALIQTLVEAHEPIWSAHGSGRPFEIANCW